MKWVGGGFYIQVGLSSKTAVSQLLASPSVGYLRSTCHRQHLYLFIYLFISWSEWCRNGGGRIVTIVPPWKMWVRKPVGAPAAVWRKTGIVRWFVAVDGKDTEAQGRIQSKVNDQIWVSVFWARGACCLSLPLSLLSSLLSGSLPPQNRGPVGWGGGGGGYLLIVSDLIMRWLMNLLLGYILWEEKRNMLQKVR